MAGDTMSRRPLQHPVEDLAKAQSRMAPGGLLWSESPIPRKFSPRVLMLGDDTAPVLACGPDFWRDSLTATTAHFLVADAGGYPGFITAMRLTWTSAHEGDVQWRVLSLDPHPDHDPPAGGMVPSPWYTVTGPGSGVSASDVIANSADWFSGFTVEWDVAGGLVDVCADLLEGG